MDATLPAIRPDVVATTSMARPTARPARPFSEVLAQGASGIVRGAEGALSALPGAPLMALAFRGGSSGLTRPLALAGAASSSPEGPGATGSGSGLSLGAGTGTGTTGASGTTADGGVESTLAQSQEMNMYYLQIQEQVNAENRSYSALSNVLKAEHDTVKTAIGNIR